jgi:DNA gyrase subunit A
MARPKLPESIAKEIIDIAVDDEMRDSFMPYALSVTTSRAIPDVRDGLKPVQRRILFVMNDLGLRPGTPFRKSAGVVGEVMGKYHPHGDGAIYEAMVRMGQKFSMSVPLVAPKGNFGSLDDPPAAYRYTEARLTEAAMAMVQDIDEETVDFRPNFDGEREEPECLPAMLPNLLTNGASGIAVGMATNMPPHNISEVVAVVKHILHNRRPRPTLDELVGLLPGPDFPTGGIIIDDGTLRDAYETGRGTFRIRARVEIEPISARRQAIIVTELPYTVGPERVQAKIRELVNKGRLEGVAAVTDLSDRNHGLRLVIECKSGVGPHKLLNTLYRLTPLEESFGINNVALVSGVPSTLGLRSICQHFIDHRLDVVTKRTQYRLRKAQEREHILVGLLIALDHIDQVIKIIRGAADVPIARSELIQELKLSDIQANHILDMQLRRLTALEVDKLRTELAELESAIKGYLLVLNSEHRRRTIVSDELDFVAQEFGETRKTKIVKIEDIVSIDDEAVQTELVPEDITNLEVTLVTLSSSGLIGRFSPDDSFIAKPGRHDVLAASVEASTMEPIFAITDKGRLLSVRASEIPEMIRGSRGASSTEMFSLGRGEGVVGLSTIGNSETVLVTRQGVLKRISAADLARTRNGNSLIKLRQNDVVISAFEAEESSEIAVVASDGQVLRTALAGVPIQGPGASGVAGMKLKTGCFVLSAGKVEFSTIVVVVTDEGTCKATDMSEVPTKGRATGGVRVVKFKNFETTLAYSWVGRDQQLAGIIADSVDPKKSDSTPVPISFTSTRRDGPAIDLGFGLQQLGEYRFR